MPVAAFLPCGCSGHGPFPPRPSSGSASKTYITGFLALNVGSAYASHCNPSPSCHGSSVASGSGKVLIEGSPAGRIGDAVGCGSVIVQGAPKVIIGG